MKPPATAGLAAGDPLDQLAAQIDSRERAAALEREHQMVQTLTRGFVPVESGPVAGHEVGIVYRPADGQAAGGDFYGAWELPGDRAAVLIGDVSGKGLETAATSAMVRFFIEALSWSEDDPAAVFARVDEILCQRLPEDTLVTAFLAFIGPGGLCYANAGHLPPVLIRSGGEGAEFEVGDLPLGVGAGEDWANRRVELAPGDLLLAYTDGLVEARREGELFGMRRMRDLLADVAPGGNPGAIAAGVHDAVRSWAGGLEDDTVVLALRPAHV